MGLPQRVVPSGLRPAHRPRAVLGRGDRARHRRVRRPQRAKGRQALRPRARRRRVRLATRLSSQRGRSGSWPPTPLARAPVLLWCPCRLGPRSNRRAPSVDPSRRRRAQPARWLLVGASALVACVALPVASAATSARAGWVISIASPTGDDARLRLPLRLGRRAHRRRTSRTSSSSPTAPCTSSAARRRSSSTPPCRSRRPPSTTPRDTAVSFTIKPGRRWSDGEPVTAQGVVEWLNLLAAYPGMWGDYLAPAARPARPLGIPDDLREVTVSGETVTMTLAGPGQPDVVHRQRAQPDHPAAGVLGPLRAVAPPRAGDRADEHHGAATGDFTAPTSDAGCYSTHLDRRRQRRGRARRSSTRSGRRTVVSAADVAQAQRCVDVVQLYRSMAFDTVGLHDAGHRRGGRVGDERRALAARHVRPATGGVHDGAQPRDGRVGPARRPRRCLSFVPCASCRGLRGAARSTASSTRATLPLAGAPPVRSLAAGPSHNPLRAEGLSRAGRRAVVDVVRARTTSPRRPGAGGHAGTGLLAALLPPGVPVARRPARDDRRATSGLRRGDDRPDPDDAGDRLRDDGRQPRARTASARSAALLASHGWHVAPGRLTTCAVADQVRRGHPAGHAAVVHRRVRRRRRPHSRRSVALLAHDAAKVGIELTASPRADGARARRRLGRRAPTGTSRAGTAAGATRRTTTPRASGCSPRAPRGTSAASPTPHATSLVAATLRSPTQLAAYDAYVAAQLPVVWQPTPVTLLETSASIHDVVASPLGAITPEAWRR